jgi:transposase
MFPYHRLAPRRSKRKAVVAVAYSILVIAYQALKNQLPSKKDLGPEYFDRLKVTRLQRLYVKLLESLGFKITLKPLPKAA